MRNLSWMAASVLAVGLMASSPPKAMVQVIVDVGGYPYGYNMAYVPAYTYGYPGYGYSGYRYGYGYRPIRSGTYFNTPGFAQGIGGRPYYSGYYGRGYYGGGRYWGGRHWR